MRGPQRPVGEYLGQILGDASLMEKLVLVPALLILEGDPEIAVQVRLDVELLANKLAVKLDRLEDLVVRAKENACSGAA